ncbi:vWA domain-containing protein [Aquibacillus kalidii]|uniref:vWA domain-containing protein n=1 Tax=Aquibacillus kalidii TaxID=2762597 RepID=UPI001647FA2B|nr:VWA domain-containing protein [Aquibacillus kalidii]
MGVLTPISFVFLMSIPLLLLLYFFKKQYENQPISSIYLWEQTMKEWETDRWWKRLQKNILLLLQLLFLLFIIIALTRPFLDGKEVFSEHVVIIMDTSATMSVTNGSDSRFQSVKQEAKELVDKLGDDQQVSLIEAQRAPILLASSETDLPNVDHLLNEMEISFQHENMVDSIQLAQSLIKNGTGEIHIFTDHLQTEQLKELDITSDIVIHNRSVSSNNLSLTTFGVKPSGETVAAIVTIENQTAEEKEFTLSIEGEDGKIKQLTDKLAAAEQKTLTINDLPLHNHYTAKLDDDDYDLDNTIYALLPKQTTDTVYLVGDTNPFVEKALNSASIDTVVVTKNDQGEYAYPDNEQVNTYIVSNVEADKWPKGPKIILSPKIGGPFAIKEKKDLSYSLQSESSEPILQFSNVKSMYLSKAFQVGDWQGLKPIVKSGEEGVIAKGNYQRSPIVLFAFDINDSDWPLHPGFPILLANSIHYLSADQETLGYFTPLESMTINLSPTTEKAIIETLDGDDLYPIVLNQKETLVPKRPSMYQLHEQTSYGSEFRPFVVQLPDEEKIIRSVDSFSLNRKGEASDTKTLSKLELWRIFAAIALLILFIEWEVYRRGISSR